MRSGVGTRVAVALVLGSLGACCLETVPAQGSTRSVIQTTGSPTGGTSTSGSGSTIDKLLDGGFPASFSPIPVAGSGDIGRQDGPGASATFIYPVALARDGAGNLYVADRDNELVRKIDLAGNVTTVADLAYGRCGSLETAQLYSYVTGIALDALDHLFVVQDACVHLVTRDGGITTFAGNGIDGFMDGTGGPLGTAEFHQPYSAVVDLVGNVIVADWFSRIRRVDPTGNVTTIAGDGIVGFADGPAAEAEFFAPGEIAIDPIGNILVADSRNNRIRRIDTSGAVTTLAGNGALGAADGTGGPEGMASFNNPQGVAIDAAGNVLVADSSNDRIRRIDPRGNVSTIRGGDSASLDDPTSNNDYGGICSPVSLVLDDDENLYVACFLGMRILKLAPTW